MTVCRWGEEMSWIELMQDRRQAARVKQFSVHTNTVRSWSSPLRVRLRVRVLIRSLRLLYE